MPEMLEKAEINPKTRPYQLTVPEIGRLCHVYHEIIQREPTLARYNNRQPKSMLEDEETDLGDSDEETHNL